MVEADPRQRCESVLAFEPIISPSFIRMPGGSARKADEGSQEVQNPKRQPKILNNSSNLQLLFGHLGAKHD